MKFYAAAYARPSLTHQNSPHYQPPLQPQVFFDKKIEIYDINM